jgi:hypothetical protein
MKLQTVVRATYPHKWTAIFDNGKKVNFGHQDYQDYTQSHSVERRKLYRQRHAKDLETKLPTKPGYLSFYILWGDSTNINANIKSYKNKFNL